MTVSYSFDVSRARFCGFTRLLLRWKGSIYKILWQEFLFFCLAYAAISITYRNFLNTEQKLIFERVVLFVETFTDAIPLTFVLGFYVSLVVGRWWCQYETIPWPDRLCFMISSYVHGSDERSRMIRRTLGRYIILAQALTFQAVSTSVKRRFPTINHLVSAGIMTRGEQSVYEKISFMYGKWWIPCHWFSALATRARKEDRIKDSILLNGLLKEMMDYRTSCAIMYGYDWISVPLVYTQVVTIATVLYSTALLVGRQYLDPQKGYSKHEVDLYIPFFTLLQFFFYIGWLKVAEQILNPYGEDDDDFELNWCLDRTVNLVYLVVDNLQLKHPKVSKDFFWDEIEPMLPQTKHSAKFFVHPQLGSGSSLSVEETEYLPMDALFEEDKDENIYKSNSLKHTQSRPSLIRRMLSSGFNRSRRRLTGKSNTVKSNDQAQAFDNLAYDSEQGKKELPSPRTDMLNNSFDSNRAKNSQNLRSQTAFRPNSFKKLQKWKTHNLQDADTMLRRSYPLHGSSEETPASDPLSRTLSAPAKSGYSIENSEDDDDEEAETVSIRDDGASQGMASIPEETAKTRPIKTVDSQNGAFAQLQNVHQLVQRASEALITLNRSMSKENTAEHRYSSCCSGNNSEVESEDEIYKASGPPKDAQVVSIDIERETQNQEKIDALISKDKQNK